MGSVHSGNGSISWLVMKEREWAFRPSPSLNPSIFTKRRSIGCFQRNLFVCLFVNTITSKRVNIGRWNLGVGTLYPSSNFGGHSPVQFCVDSNHMSHWNISNYSITFARWRHIPSLLAQSLQPTVTQALQRVAYGYDSGKISAGCLVSNIAISSSSDY